MVKEESKTCRICGRLTICRDDFASSILIIFLFSLSVSGMFSIGAL
jgi:hypothetical protein